MQRNSYCSLKAHSKFPRFSLALRFERSGIFTHDPRSSWLRAQILRRGWQANKKVLPSIWA